MKLEQQRHSFLGKTMMNCASLCGFALLQICFHSYHAWLTCVLCQLSSHFSTGLSLWLTPASCPPVVVSTPRSSCWDLHFDFRYGFLMKLVGQIQLMSHESCAQLTRLLLWACAVPFPVFAVYLGKFATKEMGHFPNFFVPSTWHSIG